LRQNHLIDRHLKTDIVMIMFLILTVIFSANCGENEKIEELNDKTVMLEKKNAILIKEVDDLKSKNKELSEKVRMEEEARKAIEAAAEKAVRISNLSTSLDTQVEQTAWTDAENTYQSLLNEDKKHPSLEKHRAAIAAGIKAMEEARKIESKIAKLIECAQNEIEEAERLLANSDPAAKIPAEKAVACAKELLAFKTVSAKEQKLEAKARKVKGEIERKIVPTKKEFKYCKELWAQLDANPTVDEDKIKRRVDKRFGLNASQAEKAYLKVTVYEQWEGKQITDLIEARIKTTSKVASVVYEPTDGLVIVKLEAKAGWSDEKMTRTIKMDVIQTVGSVFDTTSSIREVTVWATAPTLPDGEHFKVMQVEVGRKKYNSLGKRYFERADPDSATKLKPWYSPAMAK